jgi:hypothetical protein
VTLHLPTFDVHRGDPHWDYDLDENPRPDSTHLTHAALIRSLPVQRVVVGEKEEVK